MVMEKQSLIRVLFVAKNSFDYMVLSVNGPSALINTD